MHIHHIAIWTDQLERLKDFYIQYFGAKASPKYTNPMKRFESYFLSFSDGAKIELMRQEERQALAPRPDFARGYTHLAFAIGTEAEVDQLTARLEQDGYTITSRPRRTGDGYYESQVLDPDGNPIEITAG